MQGKTEAQFDSEFARMKSYRTSSLFYTHGVIPVGTSNRASQAIWGYFVAKIEEGITAGWLEPTTLADLMANERVEMPLAPPA